MLPYIAACGFWLGVSALCAAKLEENETKRTKEVWEPTSLDAALWRFERRNGGPPMPKQAVGEDE